MSHGSTRSSCRNSGGGRRFQRWHPVHGRALCQSRDRRVRLIDASPVPGDWTGKTWGLYAGFEEQPMLSHEWVLCIDADVRCSPLLVPSLLAHAERTGVSTFSVATRQHLSGLGDALLHPSLLTTLVYRFGMPGKATGDSHQVQANGQCFFSRRETLLKNRCVPRCSTLLVRGYYHGSAIGRVRRAQSAFMKATAWSGPACTKTGMRPGAIGPGRCPRGIGTSAGVKP